MATKTEVLSESPGELENALSMLQCVLVARRTRTNPEQLTWGQYDLLETLRIRGPMSPSRLSDALGISRQSTSKGLRVLKDRALVGQAVPGADRRTHTLSLTEAGEEFLARAAHSRREAAELAASVLTPGERRLFAELCDKVATALND